MKNNVSDPDTQASTPLKLRRFPRGLVPCPGQTGRLSGGIRSGTKENSVLAPSNPRNLSAPLGQPCSLPHRKASVGLETSADTAGASLVLTQFAPGRSPRRLGQTLARGRTEPRRRRRPLSRELGAPPQPFFPAHQGGLALPAAPLKKNCLDNV